MNNEELKEYWKESGCSDFVNIEGAGLCAIHRFMFTFGIVSGLDEFSYQGRWCYPSYAEAILGLKLWDGTKDPLGQWIKYKGIGGEYSNVNNINFNIEWDKPSPHSFTNRQKQ